MGKKSRLKRMRQVPFRSGDIVRLNKTTGGLLPGTYRFEGFNRKQDILQLSVGDAKFGIKFECSSLLERVNEPDFEKNIPARLFEIDQHLTEIENSLDWQDEGYVRVAELSPEQAECFGIEYQPGVAIVSPNLPPAVKPFFH